MSDATLPANAASPAASWLTAVVGLDRTAALAYLQQENQLTIDALQALATAALPAVESAPDHAAAWLDLATALRERLVAAHRAGVSGADPSAAGQLDADIPAAVDAQLAYASARLLVHQGQLAAAETMLRQAQTQWQRTTDTGGFARTLLGLTQILALQGRYPEAEQSVRTAIARLTPADAAAQAPDFAEVLQRAGAHHNLATLLIYTARHAAALAEYTTALQLLAQIEPAHLAAEARRAWTIEVAHNELNQAEALTFLDQPDQAEATLLRAAAHFQQADDRADHGRVQTNLGWLYLRLGHYAAALRAFDRATTDLLGEQWPEQAGTAAALRQADELLLEQAMAYLVMNLLPEAEQALTRCEALFRTAQQPYELGQTLYTLGLLRLRANDLAAADPLLAEAYTHFDRLENRFWRNRAGLAQAALRYARGEHQPALLRLDELIAAVPVHESAPDEPLQWDLGGLVELYLLRLRLALVLGDRPGAAQWVARVAPLIGVTWTDLAADVVTPALAPVASADAPDAIAAEALPHYALRLYHLLGRFAQAEGLPDRARAYFLRAIALLERTRALLPVEEIRTAFLDDKAELYADLILLLLDRAAADPTAVAEAFAAVERARSRALLERLLAATSDAASIDAAPSDATGAGAQPLVAQTGEGESTVVGETAANDLRRRLHWLYNQLLGESGSRRLDTHFSAQLLAGEAALKRIEWRQSTLLQQAEPTDLRAFQAALEDDQQALVYAILETAPGSRVPVTGRDEARDETRGEVMAFLIDRHSIRPYRHLTTTAALVPALDELRFQLGRAELGTDYLLRHAARLQQRLHQILGDLYQQLLAPLRTAITAPRLLIVPFGPLHRLPFHALWDGHAYLIEQLTCSYAPSASVVVQRQPGKAALYQAFSPAFTTWAGLAVEDAAIPAARAEVTGAARYFADAQLYLDHAANREGLERAAQADLLHLATHGLFRPDNPFFSALKLADGWIDVRELYRLPLQARLVVLSACESGAGAVRGGDEVVGLVRGFLGAGAREVLASLWNVHDASAVPFMQHFYQFLTQEAVNRPADALRAAQCAAISSRLHPYYWASFYMIGD